MAKNQGFTDLRTYGSYAARAAERLAGDRIVPAVRKETTPREIG
jgi:hypothetical protein